MVVDYSIRVLKEQRTKLQDKLLINEKELGYAIMQHVIDEYFGGDFDDAGCDWYTKDTKVYVGGEDWLVSENPHVAVLVDAANILRYGKKLELD